MAGWQWSWCGDVLSVEMSLVARGQPWGVLVGVAEQQGQTLDLEVK